MTPNEFFYELERLKYQLRTGTLVDGYAFLFYAFVGTLSAMVGSLVQRKPLPVHFQLGVFIIAGLIGIGFNRFTKGMYDARIKLFKNKGFEDDAAYLVAGQRRM
jgi:hypothetical protein